MRKRELLKKLNNLQQEIKPDFSWQKKNREVLLSQIKAQTNNSDFVFSRKLLFKNIFLATYKPLGSFILIAGILFGTWIATVGAARKSLPGDFWYGFKLTTERMQVNLTLNDEKRTNLEIAFADRRLDEIKKTTAKGGSTKNNKNLEVTLKNFQESINNVKTNLAKLEATDKQAAIKVANQLDEKSKTYIDILKEQQSQAPQLADSQDAQQAITVSQAIGDKALDIILQEFEAGSSGMSMDEVRQKIQDRVTDLKTSIATAKDEIDKIITNKKIADEAAVAKALADKKAAEEAAAKAAADAEAAKKADADAKVNDPTGSSQDEQKTNSNINANANVNTNVNVDVNTNANAANTNSDQSQTNTNQNVNSDNSDQATGGQDQTVVVLPTIEDIKDKPVEAEKLLSKAEDFLKNGSLSQAFNLVKQAGDIMAQVEQVISANKQYLEAPTPIDASTQDNSNTSADNTVSQEKTKS